MQKLTSRSLLSLGAIGLALLPLSGAAQAAPKDRDRGGPPVFAPAYGRRDRDANSRNGDFYGQNGDYTTQNSGRGRGRNGRGDADDVRYGNYGRIVTLEGVVTRVDSNGSFQVQAGGRNFDVTGTSGVRVRQGQRVTLRGSFDQNNNFSARSVSVVGRGGDFRDDNDPYGNDYRPGGDQRVNFPGVVSRVFNSGELEVRADNGRTYRVTPRGNSNEYQVGNRIRVTGTASGSRIDDARITFQNGGVAGGIGGIFGNRGGGNTNGDFRNDDFGNGGGLRDGSRVDFRGRIVRINTGGRTTTAIVRGDNGRQYVVSTSDFKNFREGQRIRVQGTVENGIIEGRDIDSSS